MFIYFLRKKNEFLTKIRLILFHNLFSLFPFVNVWINYHFFKPVVLNRGTVEPLGPAEISRDVANIKT